MYNANLSHPMDLCFIGSGISSTFTLIHLLENRIENQTKTFLEIAIIEKYEEFHTGIPYGKRSGDSVLLITSLKNFLPNPEYTKFIHWLHENYPTLINRMESSGGDLTKQWLKKYKESIDKGQWGDLFIPRHFFGIYLKDKLNQLINQQSSKGVLKVHYINTQVTDVTKNDPYFTIIGGGLQLQSKKVILGIGSLPNHKIYTDKNILTKDKLLLINQIYNPNLDENLERISNFTSSLHQSGSLCNILIIGANASALELLYKLNDRPHKGDYTTNYFFLSTHGVLPDCEVDSKKQADYNAIHLNNLQSESDLTAAQIAEAAELDLDAAEKIHLGAASTVGIISNAFGNLLSKLNSEELKNFACLYGNEIGRRQRCAGQHYLDVIDDLNSKGQFRHLKGRFRDLIKQNNGDYHLLYQCPGADTPNTSSMPFHVVINCIGSAKFGANNNQVPTLLKNLINKGLARPNASQIGLQVNSKLECSENIHVVGPLLAGNIIESKAVWHVEHCGRIIWLSGVLAKTIVQPQQATITS